MQERERIHQPVHRSDGAMPEEDRMADLRSAADRLVGNTGRALERAVSADSVAFLQANQQTIGQ